MRGGGGGLPPPTVYGRSNTSLVPTPLPGRHAKSRASGPHRQSRQSGIMPDAWSWGAHPERERGCALKGGGGWQTWPTSDPSWKPPSKHQGCGGARGWGGWSSRDRPAPPLTPPFPQLSTSCFYGTHPILLGVDPFCSELLEERNTKR